MGSPQTSASPSDPSEILVPTTELITLECPRFRILILGRSGVGKSSLINTIFKVNFADVQDSQAGRADINEEITSEHNKHLVVHDSQGYETADTEKFNTLTSFILKRSRKDRVADRLHAIWLCIPVPFAGGRVLEIGDEKIFEYQNKVPIIVVFTKFDLLVASVMARTKCSSIDERQRCSEIARKEFKDKHSQAFKNLTKNISSTVPHVLVAISLPNTLEQLVKVTMQNIHVVNNTRLATSTPKSISQLLPAQDRLSAPVPQSSGNSRLTTESLSSTEPQPSTLSPSPSLPPSAATQQVRLRSGSIWFKKWFGKRNKVLNDNKLAMSESNLSQPVRSVDRPPENNSHLSLPGGARLDNSSDPAQREEDSANNSDQIPRRNESHDFSDIVKISLVMAQRVDPEIKIAASIRVGKKTGAEFFDLNILNCLNAIHTDIVAIWNIRELSEFLFGDSFRGEMTRVVKDLSDQNQNDIGVTRSAITAAGALAGLTSTILMSAAFGPAAAIVTPVAAVAFVAAWAFGVYKKTPANIRCLMAYVVDLTLILEAIFRASLKDKDGRVGKDHVEKIVDQFNASRQKVRIHDAIKAFVDRRSIMKDNVVERMEILIDENKTLMPDQTTSTQ